MQINKFLVATMLIIFLTACENSAENNLPGIDIPMSEMNKAFVVEDPPEMANSHKNNEPLALGLINKSANRIILPDNYGIKIFKKDDQNWIPIENNLQYSSGDITLLTFKESPLGLLPVAMPLILGMTLPVTIRVVFVGHYDDSGAKNVGAYIELTLFP